MKGVVLMLEGVTDIAIPPCPVSNSAWRKCCSCC
jgi:hypothetical protein